MIHLQFKFIHLPLKLIPPKPSHLKSPLARARSVRIKYLSSVSQRRGHFFRIVSQHENQLFFQHFHILGLIGSFRGPPGAYSEPFGASRCSFGALWSLQMLIWSPLEPPEAHLEPFGASRMQLWSLFSQSQSFREPPRANFHHPGAQSVYLGAPDTKRH